MVRSADLQQHLMPLLYAKLRIFWSALYLKATLIQQHSFSCRFFLLRVACLRSGPMETDRDVLLHFYQTTGGGSWKYQTGWEENAENLGSWYGVTTNRNDRVVKLELQGNYLDVRFTGNASVRCELKVLAMLASHLNKTEPDPTHLAHPQTLKNLIWCVRQFTVESHIYGFVST